MPIGVEFSLVMETLAKCQPLEVVASVIRQGVLCPMTKPKHFPEDTYSRRITDFRCHLA